MNTESGFQQKMREEHPFDEHSMRWFEQFDSFRTPRVSDASLIVLSEGKDGKSNEDSQVDMSRIPSYSELREPIMQGFISNEAKDFEEKVKSALILKTPNRAVSDIELRKASQAFYIDFDRQLKESSDSLKELSSQENLPAWAPYSHKHRKVLSSPIIDLFNCESVFEKVDSLRTDSLRTSEISCRADDRKIAVLKAECDELRENLEKLSRRNEDLAQEQRKIRDKAKKDADDFQNTIDQLVEQVVCLENESEEKRNMLSCIWEESQVAQQAAKHRRKMITSLRRDHLREIKKLKERLLKKNERKKSSETWPGLQDSSVPDLRNMNTDLTIAGFMGSNYISPLKQKRDSLLKAKPEGSPAARRDSLKQGKWLLKPECDSNDKVLTKLAERGFEDGKLFQVTVVERSLAKDPIVTSFELVEHGQNAEISDLMIKLQCAAALETDSNEKFLSSTEENELAGFGEKVEFNSNLQNFRDNFLQTRPRRRPEGHKRRRSWSAPPNRTVAISLLRSFHRSFKNLKISKDHDHKTRRLSSKIAQDARSVVERTSLRPNKKKRCSSSKRPMLSLNTSYGKVTTDTFFSTNEKTPNGSHPKATESAEQGELFLSQDMEGKAHRLSNEWKDHSLDGFDSLERDLGNHYSREPFVLSLEPQISLIFPSCDWIRSSRNRRSRQRTSRPRTAYSSCHERHERSPSFTLV